MHVCPAFAQNFPMQMRETAISNFAELSIIAGDFPPNSNVTGVRCFAAADITILATEPFPVYLRCSTKKVTHALVLLLLDHCSSGKDGKPDAHMI